MAGWERYESGAWVAQDGISYGTASELRYWQTKAALLDPLAYDATLAGANATATVPAGQTWYIVEAWQVAAPATFFHRKPDALGGNVIPVKAGETITCNSNSGAHVLICKPPVVIAADTRYTTDPRGLFFDRASRLESELTHYDIGHVNTGSTAITTTFPTDFTNGVVIHCSSHDVAWTGLNGSAGAVNLDNEISDSNRIRFAERVTLPFVRATYPGIKSQGASQAEGAVNVRYVKLPADW